MKLNLNGTFLRRHKTNENTRISTELMKERRIDVRMKYAKSSNHTKSMEI